MFKLIAFFCFSLPKFTFFCFSLSKFTFFCFSLSKFTFFFLCSFAFSTTGYWGAVGRRRTVRRTWKITSESSEVTWIYNIIVVKYRPTYKVTWIYNRHIAKSMPSRTTKSARPSRTTKSARPSRTTKSAPRRNPKVITYKFI